MIKGWSLASRLALWFTASTFFLILVATGTIYWSLARTLNIEDTLLISDKVQTVLHLLSTDPNLKSIRERVEKEWANRKFERVYVKVLDQTGATITETPDFNQISQALFDGIPTFDLDHTGRAAQRRETRTGRIFKVEIVRAVLGTANPQARVIQIALDRTREETFLATYRSRLLIVLFVTLLISALIGRKIAARGIRPIADIAEATKTIRLTTLHERINVSNVPAELAILATTFNEMLDRLNESFERLSRFSQDIAHDLRTPINNLRGELEVALGRLRTPQEYQDVLGSCLEECARLSHLIDSLLFLARAENPSAQLAIETINLHNEVVRLTDFFEASFAEAEVKLVVDIEPTLALSCDRALLQRALANLISNAINYTPKGGLVTIAAKGTATEVDVEVWDSGAGIPDEHLSKVFDRFYRVDESRSAKSGGSGLGLSIVKSIMSLHKGKAQIASQVDKGTRVRLTFPNA